MRQVRFLVAVFSLTVLVGLSDKISDFWMLLIAGFIGLLFIVNQTLKNKLAFQGWFVSPVNFFVAKHTDEVEVPGSPEFAIEQLKRIIGESHFKLKDEEENRLLASKKMSWSTWGENVYLEVLGDERGSTVKITSVTVFGIYDIGKNEDNVRELSQSLESALIA